jgi:hypothetical protein
VKGAGGDQVQDRLFALDDQRVAGVIAALEADYDIGILGEEVDDLPFALVSPLSSDNSDVGHISISDFRFNPKSKIKNPK